MAQQAINNFVAWDVILGAILLIVLVLYGVYKLVDYIIFLLQAQAERNRHF